MSRLSCSSARLVVIGALIGVVVAAAPAAHAQLSPLEQQGPDVVAFEQVEPADGDDTYSVADLLEDPRFIHPDVVGSIEVDLETLGNVGREMVQARTERDDSVDRLTVATANRLALQGRIVAIRGELRRGVRALHVATLVEAEAERVLAALAVQTFIDLEDAALNPARGGFAGSTYETLATNSREQVSNQLVLAVKSRISADTLVASLSDELNELERDAQLEDDRAIDAELDREAADLRMGELQGDFENAVLLADVAGTDIPVVVFDGYYRAAMTLAEEQPLCEVRWDHLAGVGKVESSHGSFGGNVVQLSGRTDGEILGPVLDGEVFSEILDTDGGLLDGDTEWDRAVGPMQFIPGSWSIYGRDGNEDGKKDPHNLYDAALAAGAHLCGSTGGLSDDARLRHALLGYNQSAPYGVAVMNFAETYLDVVGEIVVVPTEDELLLLAAEHAKAAPVDFGGAEFGQDLNSGSAAGAPS